MDDPFTRMQDPARRAERYRKVAAEYFELADVPRPRSCVPTTTASLASTSLGRRVN